MKDLRFKRIGFTKVLNYSGKPATRYYRRKFNKRLRKQLIEL